MNFLVISILTLAVLALVAWRVTRFLRFWIAEGEKLYTETGYVVPKVSRAAAFAQHWLSWLACRIVIGPVTYIKHPAIDEWNGRLIAAATHKVMGDIPVLLSVKSQHANKKRRTWRYMSAREQLEKKKRRWFMAWTGCVSVLRQEKRKAAMALKAAAEGLVLDRESDFAVFPQGRLNGQQALDVQQIHDGFVTVGVRAQEGSGDKFAVSPVYIGYLEQPYGLFSLPLLRRLRHVEFEMSDDDLKPSGIMIKLDHYGAIVIAGAPIAIDDMPKKAEERKALLLKEWLAMKALVDSAQIKRGRIRHIAFS